MDDASLSAERHATYSVFQSPRMKLASLTHTMSLHAHQASPCARHLTFSHWWLHLVPSGPSAALKIHNVDFRNRHRASKPKYATTLVEKARDTRTFTIGMERNRCLDPLVSSSYAVVGVVVETQSVF